MPTKCPTGIQISPLLFNFSIDDILKAAVDYRSDPDVTRIDFAIRCHMWRRTDARLVIETRVYNACVGSVLHYVS